LTVGRHPACSRRRFRRARRGTSLAHRGTSLIELLVGLVIGLVAVTVILGLFAGVEAVKRNASGAAEAQQTGMLLMHVLGADLASAGNGLAPAANELGTCPDSGDVRTSLRPFPALIIAGASVGEPDAIVVNYAAAPVLAAPVAFAADAAAGAPLRIRSPLGVDAGDAVIAISLAGSCALTRVTSVSPPDPDGIVDVAHAGLTGAFPHSSLLLNLGPRGRMQRVRYDVVDGTLRSLDLLTPDAVPNPLASNVVTLKAQYGIDADNDGYIDAWVAADRAPWTAASVLAAPSASLLAIKAVRFGLIVKSETYDREQTRRFDWVLFDCELADKARCAGRLEGSLPARWRYRVYEKTVPLRNPIWNAGP
jgi:type IV pilus assembly protein PilW